ncbi:cell wall surface anchor protein, partial [Enterococcus faecalis]
NQLERSQRHNHSGIPKYHRYERAEYSFQSDR